MLKIAVFGTGRGGEAVAKYLSTELNTVEVIEVIDWSGQNGAYEDLKEMNQTVCRFLSPYIKKVDLVVLADYMLSLVIDSLRVKWPEQKIIGMEVDFRHVSKSCQHANVVTLLANETLLQTELGKKIYRQLSYADIIIPDCSGWEKLIDDGCMSKDVLKIRLEKILTLANDYTPQSRFQESHQRMKIDLRTEIVQFLVRTTPVPRPRFAFIGAHEIDSGEKIGSDDYYSELAMKAVPQRYDKVRSTEVVYLLNPYFWNIEEELRDLFSYRVEVISFKRKLLHDTCLALKLRGVDGLLGK